MKKSPTQNDLLAAWQTSNRVTEFFFENLPNELWNEKIPGASRKTIRMVAGHIHNARCMWIKMIGKNYGITPPKGVDRRLIKRASLLSALKKSNNTMIKLINIGLAQNGTLGVDVPWMNMPPDVTHFICYMIAHEAHHRGQIILVARSLGHRLRPEVTNGIWQWKKRHKETATKLVNRHL